LDLFNGLEMYLRFFSASQDLQLERLKFLLGFLSSL
jgi:hypothetical protein